MHASKDEQMIAIGGRMNESLSHLYSIRIFLHIACMKIIMCTITCLVLLHSFLNIGSLSDNVFSYTFWRRNLK